jgi:replication factor C large subunit
MVPFKKIDQRTILRVLKEICKKQEISTDERVLKIIATNANGDLRCAQNDLQALAEGKKKLEIQDTEILSLRDSEMRIHETLARILKTTSCDRAREAIWESGEDPSTLLKWVAENLPLEYEDAVDLAAGFDAISKADVFLGRIMKRQDWGLLSYASDMLSAGVALAKKKSYRKFLRYQYPGTFVMYARTRKQKEIGESIAGKMSVVCHGSRNLIKKEFFPLLKFVMGNISMGPKLASELEFTLEEIKFFVENENLARKIYEKLEPRSRSAQLF